MYKLGPLDNNGQNQDVFQCNNTDVYTRHNMNNASCSMSPPASESGPKSTTSVLRRWRRPESHDSGPKNVPTKDAPVQPPAYVAPPVADADKQMNPAGSYAPTGETSAPNTGSDFSMYVPQLSPLVPQSTARPYDKYLMQYGEAYRKDKNGTYYQDGTAQEFRSSGYTPPLAHSASQKCVLPENNTYQSRQSTHRDYSVVSYSSQKIQEPKEDYCLSNNTYPVQNMDRRVSPHNPKSPIYRNFPQQNYVPTTKSAEYIAQNTNYCITQKPAQTVIDSRYANYNQNYYKQVPTQDPKYRNVSNPKKSSPPFPILEQRLNQPEGNYCAEYTPQGYYPSKYGPVMYSRTSPTPKIVRDGPGGTLNYPVHHNQKIVPQEYSFPNKYYQQNQGYEQNLYLTQMNQMHARLPHTKNDVPRDLSYAETNQRLAQKNRMYCPEAAPVEHLHYLGKPGVPQKSPKMVTYNLTEQRTPENVPDYVNLSRSCGTIQRTAKVGEYSPVIQSVNYQQSCPTENFACSPPLLGQSTRNPPSYPVNYPRQQNIKLNEMPARNISPRRTFQENMPVVVFSPQHIGLPKSSPTPMYPPEYPNYPGYYPRDNIYPGVKPGMPQYPVDQTKYPTVARTIPQQRYYGYPEHYYQKHADASIAYQANVYNRHYNPQQNTTRFETDYRNVASNFDFEPSRVDYGKKDSDIGKSLKEFLESWEDDEEIVANLPDLVLCNNIPPDKQKLAFGSASEASKSSDEEKDQDPDQPLYILGSTNISSEALPQYLAVYEQVDRLPDNIKGYIKDSSEDPVTEKEEKSSNSLQVPDDPIESSSPHDLTVNKNRDETEEEVLNLSTNRNKANEEFLVEECSSASEDSENQELEAKEPESVHKIEVPKENVEDLIEEVKNNDDSPVEKPEDQPMTPAENSAEKPLTASVIVPNKYFDNASQINKEDSVKEDQSEIAPKICEDSEKPEVVLEETSSQSSKKEENKLNNNLDLDVFDFEANLIPATDKIIDKKIDEDNPEEIEPISFENLINSPDYIEMKDDDNISNDFDANSFENKLEEIKEQSSSNEDSDLINSSASTPESIDQSLPENEPETENQVEKIPETELEDVSEIENENVNEAKLETVTDIEQDELTEIDSEEVVAIEDPASEIKDPVPELEEPVTEIEETDTKIKEPCPEIETVTNIEESVTEIETVIDIKDPVTEVKEIKEKDIGIEDTVTETEETIYETVTEIEETGNEIKPVIDIEESVTEFEENVTKIEEPLTKIEEPLTKIEETVTDIEENLTRNELEHVADTNKQSLDNTDTENIDKDPLLLTKNDFPEEPEEILVDKPEEIIEEQPIVELEPLKEDNNISHNEETKQAEAKSEILDEDKQDILLPTLESTTSYIVKEESLEIEDYIEDLEDPNQQIEDSTKSAKEFSEEQEEIEETASEDAIGIHVKEEIVEQVEDFEVNEEIVESSTHFESTVDKLIISNVESIQDDSNDSEIQEEINEDEYAHLVGIEEHSSNLITSSESTVDSYKENSVKNEDSNNFDFSYLESCTDNICEKPEIKNQTVRETTSAKNNSELFNNNLKCILESSESDSDATKDNETEVPEKEIKSHVTNHENDISAEENVQPNIEPIVPETVNNNEIHEPEKYLETEVFDNSVDVVENHEICETEIITSEIQVAEPEKLIETLEIIPKVPENVTEISESTAETSNRDSITNIETNVDNITENIIDSTSEDTLTNTITDTITNTIEETTTDSITESRTDTIKNTIGDYTTETITENITKNTTKTKNVTETITDTFENTITNFITETITDTMEETITNTITHTIEETIPDSIIETITETNPLQIVENLTPGSVILDESSSDENLIIPKDTQCILLYNEGERYVIIQQDSETAEIIPSEDLVSEILIPEKPAEKEEILQVTDEPIGEEIIICEEGIEDWVQNEEIIDSGREESESKEDLDSRIEETDSKVEEIDTDNEDTQPKVQENEATSIGKGQQKHLDPKEFSETFINEERKYCYPQAIFQSSVEEKELFINPENPLTANTSYPFLESTGIKRRLSYGDSSPKIDFKAPKRRYSTMDTGRTVKKPIINLEEISKNITEVLENLTKQESKLYIERLDNDFKVEVKEVKVKEKTKFYIDYEPTEKKYKHDIKEGIVENKLDVKEGIVENEPDVTEAIVENKPDVKEGIVENNPDVKEGIIENKPGFQEGIVENKPKTKQGIAENKTEIKEGIVGNKPVIKKCIVENKPKIKQGIAENKTEIKEGIVRNKPEIKKGIVKNKPKIEECIVEIKSKIEEGIVENKSCMDEINEGNTKKVYNSTKDLLVDNATKLVEPLIKPKLIIPKTKSEPAMVNRRSSLPKTPDVNKINKTFDDTSPIVNTARLTEPIFPKSSSLDVKTIAKRPNVDPRIERPKDVPEKEEKQSPIENKLSNTFGLTEYTKNFIKMKTGQTVDPKNLTINGTKVNTKTVVKMNSTRRKHQNTEEDNKINDKKIKINLQDYRNRKQSCSQSDLNISSSENSMSSSLDDEPKKDEDETEKKPKSNNAEIEENKNSVQKKKIEQKNSVEKKDLMQKKCLDEKKDELEKKDQVEKMVEKKDLPEKKISPEKKVPVMKKAEKKVERKNSINSAGNMKRKGSTETNEDPPDRKVEKLIIKPKKSLEPSKDLLIPVERSTNQEKPKVTNNTNNLEVDTVKFKSKLDLKQSKPKKRKRRFRNLYAVDEEDEVPTKQNKISLEETKLNCLLSEDSTSSRVSEDSANTQNSESSEFLCCFDGTKLIQEVSDQIRDYEINKNSCTNKLKLTLKPVKKKKPAFAEVLSNLDSVLESEILSKRPRKGKSGKSDDGTLWTIKNKVPKVIIKRNGSGYCAVFRDVTCNPIWQPKIKLKRQKYIESLVIESNVKC